MIGVECATRLTFMSYRKECLVLVWRPDTYNYRVVWKGWRYRRYHRLVITDFFLAMSMMSDTHSTALATYSRYRFRDAKSEKSVDPIIIVCALFRLRNYRTNKPSMDKILPHPPSTTLLSVQQLRENEKHYCF